jgi:hypothetical protein
MQLMNIFDTPGRLGDGIVETMFWAVLPWANVLAGIKCCNRSYSLPDCAGGDV